MFHFTFGTVYIHNFYFQFLTHKSRFSILLKHIFCCYRIGEVKEGKSFVLWDLDDEYQAVAVVGLGEKCKGINICEGRDEDRESVRVAASGMIVIIVFGLISMN